MAAPSSPLPLDPPRPAPGREYSFQGFLTFGGVPVDVETRAGATRSGVDPDGHAWSVEMPWHYGEIPGTVGLDGDAVDIMVGPDPNAPSVHVLHLRRIGRGGKATHARDEDKAYVGFRSRAAALAAFRAAYTRTDLLQGVTTWPFEVWREWVMAPENRGRPMDTLPEEEDVELAKAVGRPLKNKPGLVLQQAKHGTGRRWQRTGEVEPKAKHDRPEQHDPEWEQKSKAARGKATGYHEIAADMARAYGTLRIKGMSHADLAGSLTRVLREAEVRGKLMGAHRALAERTLGRLAKLLEQTGANPVDAQAVLQASTWKLLHQDLEAAKRTIGDHGLRHIARNCDVMNTIFDKLGDVEPVGAKERLAANLAMISHDLGYTAHKISRQHVKDDYHPEAGAQIWLQEVEDTPAYQRVLGQGLARRTAGWIAAHSKSMVDWDEDPVGTAIRVADNTHLFGDKLPEVLFNDRDAMRVLLRLHLARGVDAPKAVFDTIRGQFAQRVRGRRDIPPAYQNALAQAVEELTAKSPQFLVSRLAGRDGQIDFDPKTKTLTMHIEQSPLRQMIGQVFGEDEGDKQFLKMLRDFHLRPDKVQEEARLEGHAGHGAVLLRWEASTGTASPMELEYSAAAQETLEEAKRAAGAGKLMEWLRGGGTTEVRGGRRLHKAVEHVRGHLRGGPAGPEIIPPYRRSAVHDRHPDDESPNQVGPVTWDMDLERAERAMSALPEEHGVCFDVDGRQVGRWGPEDTLKEGADPRKALVTDPRVQTPGRTFTHNHPNGAPLSPIDLTMAAMHDLAQVRACGPVFTWICDRPLYGWPEPTTLNDAAESAFARLQYHSFHDPEVSLEQRFAVYRDELRRDPILGPFGIVPRPTRWGHDPGRGRMVSPHGWGAAAARSTDELGRRTWSYGPWHHVADRGARAGHLIWIMPHQLAGLVRLAKHQESERRYGEQLAELPELDLKLGLNGLWSVYRASTTTTMPPPDKPIPVRVRFWVREDYALNILSPWVAAMRNVGGFLVRGLGRGDRNVLWLTPPPADEIVVEGALQKGLSSSPITFGTDPVPTAVRVRGHARAGHLVGPYGRIQRVRRDTGPRPVADKHPLDHDRDVVDPVDRTMDLGEVEGVIGGLLEEHAVIFAPDGRQVARRGPQETRANGGEPTTTVNLGSEHHLRELAQLNGVVLTHNHPGEVPSPVSPADLFLGGILNAGEVRAVMGDGSQVCAVPRPWAGWAPDVAFSRFGAALFDSPAEIAATDAIGVSPTSSLDRRLRQHPLLGPMGYRVYVVGPGASAPQADLPPGSPYAPWRGSWGAQHGGEAGWRAPGGDLDLNLYPLVKLSDVFDLDDAPAGDEVEALRVALVAARGGGAPVEMPTVRIRYTRSDGSFRVDQVIGRAALAAAQALGAEILPICLQVVDENGTSLIYPTGSEAAPGAGRVLRAAILRRGLLPAVRRDGKAVVIVFQPPESWSGDVLRKAIMGGLKLGPRPRPQGQADPYGHIRIGESTMVPCTEPRHPFHGKVLRLQRVGPDEWELLDVLDGPPEDMLDGVAP